MRSIMLWERPMKCLTRNGAFGAALLILAGSALAQMVQITPEQEHAVYAALVKMKPAKPPPASFNPSVGMDLPADVEVYEVPADAALAPVRRYRYTVMGEQVVLVDPANKKVVKVFSSHE
jgi:hypothetical protein